MHTGNTTTRTNLYHKY